LFGTILATTAHPARVGAGLQALARRYPGSRVSDGASPATATDAEDGALGRGADHHGRLGIGLVIAAIALLRLSHAFTGGLPYVPARPLVAILGVTALLATLALPLPTRRALRARPIDALGIRECDG
jgi:hypothetical protein